MQVKSYGRLVLFCVFFFVKSCPASQFVTFLTGNSHNFSQPICLNRQHAPWTQADHAMKPSTYGYMLAMNQLLLLLLIEGSNLYISCMQKA